MTNLQFLYLSNVTKADFPEVVELLHGGYWFDCIANSSPKLGANDHCWHGRDCHFFWLWAFISMWAKVICIDAASLFIWLACMKSMPMMLLLMSSTTVTGCTNFLPMMVIGSSNTPKEFILDLLAATHPVPLCNSLGVLSWKAWQKLFEFMHVIAAPVSDSQLKVLSLVVTLILGWVLFPP